MYIQGLLNNNFKKYSAITLIDRQNLDKIISEQNIGANGRFSDKDYLKIGSLANAQYFMFGTIQKLSGDRYSLQLSVTDSSSGIRKAGYMNDGLLVQIEGNGMLINEASADLLAQMGVQLTDGGKQALLAGNRAAAQSEAGLARGITAQAAGSQIQALFNFSQSIAFDPSQMEALARLSQLSSTISGGSISERILNDIQARDRWLAAFRETARFFSDHPPFEITFDPNLVQEGQADYGNRTVNLGMLISLAPSEAGFTALNALLEGLDKSGKRSDWGFAGWPLLDLNPKTPGTIVFDGRKQFNCKVDVELQNEKGLTMGKSSITLNSGTINFSAGDPKVPSPDGNMDFINFLNVKADNLTPTLTIIISAVNGIPSRTLSNTGYMKIDAGDLEAAFSAAAAATAATAKKSLENFIRINGGTFTMGSPANEPGRFDYEDMQHQVTISSFYIGKYQVTQKEYRDIMGSNPGNFKGDNLPVEQVSWFDTIEYCNRRSLKEGLTPTYTVSGSGDKRTVTWNRTANGYRLPTEAEWEYACRAGTTTPFSTGNNITTAQANYDGNYPYNNNAKGIYRGTTTAVGSFPPNPWGLYDMHGNVWEWCWDWYGNYSNGTQAYPVGPASGSSRVLRGGSWDALGQNLRSAIRVSYYPSNGHDDIGFCLVRPIGEQGKN
ncbi:MAG: SUMF1/EgtB/PvdO family nonheme iron enzyme [Treponema sp.]|nr:SUMF1/EgtB/PvdO family nonheme iron enzyme [Treponema sp.]